VPVSRAALQRFLRRQTEAALGQAAVAEASAELDRIGV
jgi:hypothetical protein